MSVLKQFWATASIAVLALGCVSDPLIDECIAKLDANPVPVVSRFGLPQLPQLPISAQPLDMLVGAWETGIQHPVHRYVGRDGNVVDFDKPGKYYHDVYKNYGFNADGTYLHMDICRLATTSITLKKEGTWTYDSGKLTLRETRMIMETSDYVAKAMGLPNWQSQSTMDLRSTVVYEVKWFAHDEIELKGEEDDKKCRSQMSPRRKSFSIDDYGVRIEREYNISGQKDGREIGTITEEIHPPMRYKKKAR